MLTNQLLDQVKEQLATTGAGLSEIEISQALRSSGALQSGGELIALARDIRSQLVGYGPLEQVMQQPNLTDVLVHGDGRVYTDSQAGLVFAGKLFPDAASVRNFAQRLALQAKRRLDDAHPWVDAKLADGNRMHALLPPIAVNGAQISIRIPARTPLSFEELIKAGTLSVTAASDLVQLIQSRRSFLVIGATGAGKTSLLASMLSRVAATERIIVVEESSELKINHPHLVQLEAKPATAEGVGCISMQDLVRQTLRMRPDRIVIGEVRGSEVLDLLLALNTGHSGSAATLHANSASEVPARITALGLLAGIEPSLSKEWLLHGVSHIIQIQKIGMVRFVSSISQANITSGSYEIVSNYQTQLKVA
jgi:pilus assembly protein CpaF